MNKPFEHVFYFIRIKEKMVALSTTIDYLTFVGRTCLYQPHTKHICNHLEDPQTLCRRECLFLDRLSLHRKRSHKLDKRKSYFSPLFYLFKIRRSVFTKWTDEIFW